MALDTKVTFNQIENPLPFPSPSRSRFGGARAGSP